MTTHSGVTVGHVTLILSLVTWLCGLTDLNCSWPSNVQRCSNWFRPQYCALNQVHFCIPKIGRCGCFKRITADIARSVYRYPGWTTGVPFPAGVGILFSLSRCIDQVWGPPCLLSNGSLFCGLKRPGHEANLPPPSSDEVKNLWSCTPVIPYVFMAWYLVEHRDNFTFIFLEENSKWN
jgi:hypothetical protein